MNTNLTSSMVGYMPAVIVKRPRVFVLEPVDRIDISPAYDYGDIVYLFDRPSKRPSIWREEFAQYVIDALRKHEYSPRWDHFLIAGHMVNMALAQAAIAANYSQYNLLCYSSLEQRYIAKVVGRI